jgi:hypothetical protein
MSFTKRLRGLLLRLVLKRAVAITAGLALLAPAVWLFVRDFRWESSVTDGLGLVLGATGAAFVLAGIGGRRPDWFEPD